MLNLEVPGGKLAGPALKSLSVYSPREDKEAPERQWKTVDATAVSKTGHLTNIGQQDCLYDARSLFSVHVNTFYVRATDSSR
jgi:hypothetical protein